MQNMGIFLVPATFHCHRIPAYVRFLIRPTLLNR
jgi:hypothetical protein